MSTELYVRNANGTNVTSDEDIWDDSFLIKAYDKAVNNAKDRLAKKLGLSSDDKDKCSSDSASKAKVSPKPKVSKKKDKKGKGKWKIGDYCRAPYSVDGIEYEAEIITLLNDQCLVKYCGYGNEELVEKRNLHPSHGPAAREEQIGISSNRYRENMSKSPYVDSGSPGVPPPPPPHMLAPYNNNESEALSAMLMSWYMSGYHTGFYQGLMHSKKAVRKNSTGYNN